MFVIPLTLLCQIITAVKEYWFAWTQQFNFQEYNPGERRATGKGMLVYFLQWNARSACFILRLVISILLALYFCLIWPICFAKQWGLTLPSMLLFPWDQYKTFLCLPYILQSLYNTHIFPVNPFRIPFTYPFGIFKKSCPVFKYNSDWKHGLGTSCPSNTVLVDLFSV